MKELVSNMPLNCAREKNKSLSLFFRYISMNKALYLMLVPGILYYVIFKYIPLLGSVIAFKDYNIFKGFMESDWVGFKWFIYIFKGESFTRILTNNIIISTYQILLSFPAPIILALLLNEINNMGFKRSIQTMVYLPHFLSWTIVAGIIYMLLSSQTGIINQILLKAGLVNKPIEFLQDARYVRGIVVGSGIWKEMGWNAVVYLAAVTGISPSLYEAAKIDGAGRFKQCLYITLPGIMPTVVTLLLIKMGHILDVGFEQIYPFINPLTASKAEVFDTYTYAVGVLNGQYSMATAIGLFKSVVGLILLLLANRISKKITGEGII